MGFLNPLNLWLGLSLAALLAIYLRSRSRPTIEVSSLALFEEAPAPVRQSRLLRLDLLFWLEAAALTALTLAAGGLYLRQLRPAGPLQHDALIFDLGASTGATDDGHTRLSEMQDKALRIVSGAPPNHRFTVIAYALEARVVSSDTANREQVRAAIAGLRSTAVATRRAALRAALLYARRADHIELFSDNQPAAEILQDARRGSDLMVNLVGAPADNLAIVSLDPGVPRNLEGRCLVRNFSYRPQSAQLRIDLAGREVFHSPMIVEPRSQLVVRFGPLRDGGVIHARLETADALAADNDRYAIAPAAQARRALVVSPDSGVRDDLARVLLAVAPPYRVTAIDGSADALKQQATQKFDLVIAHEISTFPIKAAARLFIFPSSVAPQLRGDLPFTVRGEIQNTELLSDQRGRLSSSLSLGQSRLIDAPEWMEPAAQGLNLSDMQPLTLDAIGRRPGAAIGVIAFDIRNHLLLDPDKLEALLLTLDTIAQLTLPADQQVLATGDNAIIPVSASATLIQPSGARVALTPDTWDRVRVQPLEAGRYVIIDGKRSIELYANYYDEAESDLARANAPSVPLAAPAAASPPSTRETATVAQLTPLMMLVLIALLLESIVLARRRSWVSNV